MFRRREKGFTLIELMIVVVIIGILAAMAIPRFWSTTIKTKQVEAKEILRQVYTMQTTHRQQYDSYWGQGIVASAAATASFNPLGVDVAGNALYTYTMTVANTNSFTCTATCGVLDNDPAADTWQINEQGVLTVVSDDVTAQ